MGLVVAQDFGAIGKRLGGAVEAGEITLEQAFVMMEALRDSVDDMRETKERYRRDMEMIQAAAKAGKLSEGDAERKIAEMKEAIEKQSKETLQDSHKRDLRLDQSLLESEALKSRYTEYAKEIKKALESGKLSEEDAERKLMELRKKMSEVKQGENQMNEKAEAQKQEHLEALRRIEAALAQGQLSKNDAGKKLLELKKQRIRQDKTEQGERTREELKRAYELELHRIKSAVDEGKTSKEQAEKKSLELHTLGFPFRSTTDRFWIKNSVSKSVSVMRQPLTA